MGDQHDGAAGLAARRTRRTSGGSAPRCPIRLQPARRQREGDGRATARSARIHLDSLSPVLTGSGSEGLRLVRTLSTLRGLPCLCPASLARAVRASRAHRLRACPAAATSSWPRSSPGCAGAASSTPSRPSAPGSSGGTPSLDRSLPTRLVPRFAHAGRCHRGPRASRRTSSRRAHLDPARTIYYVHGGGYMAPTDPFHVRYATRLADAVGARIVLPDYPLAPEHTWRDSYEPSSRTPPAGRPSPAARPGRRLRRRRSRAGPGAVAARPRLAQPTQLRAARALGRPDDLDARTPPAVDAVDPWLFLSKVTAYADVVGRLPRRPGPARGLARRSPTSPGCRRR